MRKIFALYVLVALILPTTALAFEDVDSKAVERLLQKEILEDSKHFLPEVPCTRAQYIEWVLKNINEDVSGERIREPYIDVEPTDWFAAFVGRAWQMGVIESGVYFRPQDAITRVEALKIALKVEGISIPKGGFESYGYLDFPKAAEDRGTLHKALELGIIKPVEDKLFGTNIPMNRLECVQLIDAVALSRRSEQTIHIEVGGNQQELDGTFDEVLRALETKYLYGDQIDSEALIESAINGMVNSLNDEHTVFFTNEEVNNFLTSVGVETQYGIGSQVGIDKDGRTIIIKPLRNSQAEKAGLKPGDVILKVDDVDVSSGDTLLEEVVGLIKGVEGTTVKLEYERKGKTYQVQIVRAPIRIESLAAQVKDGYLIIEIDFFGNDTANGVRNAIEEYPIAAQKGIVIDLRNNPGGFLDAAVDLMSWFVPKDTVIVKTRGADYLHSEDVEGPGTYTDIPLVVLVNNLSASASEIVAGAVQDAKRGVVIGEQTFGKGTAQELLQFSNGTALKVTIAEWLTPDERSIEAVGITPDYVFEEVDNDEAVWEYAFRIIQRGQWQP